MHLSRRGFPALILAVAVLAGGREYASARPRVRRVMPGEKLELKTKDGWTLAAQYAAAKPGKPTFILLHQTAGHKEDWYFLAKAMTRRGIGFMALDLRGHGGSRSSPTGAELDWRKFHAESKGYNEWININQDIEAAVSTLTALGVSTDSIALGGADVGGSLAVRYAAVHREAPMVFMLSPGMSYRNVPTVNAIRAYGQRPILMVVGADDRHSVPETTVLFTFAKSSAGEKNARLVTVEREHGTNMLVANKGLITQVADWMEHPLQEAPAVSTEPAREPPPSELPRNDQQATPSEEPVRD